jgi:hypothetical protein
MLDPLRDQGRVANYRTKLSRIINPRPSPQASSSTLALFVGRAGFVVISCELTESCIAVQTHESSLQATHKLHVSFVSPRAQTAAHARAHAKRMQHIQTATCNLCKVSHMSARHCLSTNFRGDDAKHYAAQLPLCLQHVFAQTS